MRANPLLLPRNLGRAAFVLAWAVLFSNVAPAATPPAAPGIYTPPPPLAAWEFKGAPGPLGWTAAPGVSSLRLDRGKLKGTAAGESAAILSPLLTLKPSAHQIVEVHLKVDKDTALRAVGIGASSGSGTLVTTEQPSLPVPLPDDRKLKSVRLWPRWSNLNKVEQVRLDLPNAGNFEVEWVRVLDLATLPEPGTEKPDDEMAESGAKPRGPAAPSPLPGPVWNFADSAEGWTAASPLDSLQQWIGILLVDTQKQRNGLLLSPPMKARAEDFPYLTLRVKLRNAPKENRRLRFLWLRPGDPALHTLPVDLKTENEFEESVLHLSENADWCGPIIAVGLEVMPDTSLEVDFVRLGATPLPDRPTPPPGEMDIDLTKPDGKDNSLPKIPALPKKQK